MCDDVYAIPKWSINLLISCLMEVPSAINKFWEYHTIHMKESWHIYAYNAYLFFLDGKVEHMHSVLYLHDHLNKEHGWKCLLNTCTQLNYWSAWKFPIWSHPPIQSLHIYKLKVVWVLVDLMKFRHINFRCLTIFHFIILNYI